MTLHSGVWAIAFTDMIGSTEQRSRLGDSAGDALRREHDTIVADVLSRHRGERVASTGDGAMCAFESAADAIAAGADLQQRIERRNRRAAEPMLLRVGVSLGELVHEDDNLMGIAAHEAARICALCEAGEVLVSDLVRAVAGSRAKCDFESRGEFDLKGIPGPVTVWEVRWDSMAGLEPLPLPALLTTSGDAALAGRDDELGRMQAVWKRASDGHRSTVLISGEPGIGKTRLAAEIARLAYSDGAIVLAGRCDSELGPPFQPFAEALDSYLELAPDAVTGRHARELARLSSRVAEQAPRPVDAGGGDAESEQYRLFEAVASWVSAVAELQPLVLVVDDAHWATKPTLLMLRHLLRGRDADRVLVIVTYRDSEVDRDHPLHALLPELAKLANVERVVLSGLDEGDVVELLAQVGHPDVDGRTRSLAAALVDQTEGNPFFIREVLRHVVESGATIEEAAWTTDNLVDLGIPRGVREVLHERLQNLGVDAAELLEAAAIVGREFSVGVVAGVTGTDDDTTVRLLDRARSAHLVEDVAPDRYRFAHALVRGALEDEVSSSRRLRLHRRIREQLERTPTADVAALAHHALAGATETEPGRAVHYAQLAGDAALAALAPDEAADWYARSLAVLDGAAEPDQVAILAALERLGSAQVRVGDPAAYQPTWRRAADAARAFDDEPAYARTMLGYIGRTETLTQLDDFGRDGVERALDHLPIDADALRVRLMGVLASGITNFEPERATELSTEALVMARATRDEELVTDAMRARLRCWWSAFEVEDRRRLTEEMREIAARTQNNELLAQSWQWTSILAIETGDLAGLALAADELDRISEQLGLRYYRWAAAARRGALALSRGAFDDAERLLIEAFELESHGFSVFASQMMVLRWLQGRTDELDGLIPEAGIGPFSHGLFAVRALLAAEGGRTEDAHALLTEFAGGLDGFAQHALVARTFATIAARAGVHAGTGPWLEPLASFLEQYEGKFAVVHPAAASLGAIDATLGALVGMLGERARAESLLRRGIEQNRAAGLEPFTAIGLCDLAQLLAGTERDEARQAAQAALDIGTRLGMPTVAQRAENDLN